MRLIDADAILKQITEDSRGNEGWFGDTWDFLNTIKNAPTIDAVPVVRCGDCMMFVLDGADEGEGWCWWNDTIIKLTDYCSYGERRSDVRVYLPNR